MKASLIIALTAVYTLMGVATYDTALSHICPGKDGITVRYVAPILMGATWPLFAATAGLAVVVGDEYPWKCK